MKDKLVVAIDLTQEPAIDIVFPAAIDMAYGQNASLALLTVVPDITSAAMFPYVPRKFLDEARTEAQKQLEKLGNLRLPDDIEWTAEAHAGPVANTIVGYAEKTGAGLIVMASHDPTVIDILLGGTADQVIRRAHCSVLVVREPARERKRGAR